jgi:hypothetical protein
VFRSGRVIKVRFIMVDTISEAGAESGNDAACREHAEAIRTLVKRAAADIVEIGRRLIAVKALLAHGEWLPWLKREFDWSEQTARNFMNVAEAFKIQNGVLDLPIDLGALYALARPSTPEPARQTALKQAASGERITLDKAEAIVAAAKPEPKGASQRKSTPRAATRAETKYEGEEETSEHPEVDHYKAVSEGTELFDAYWLADATPDPERDAELDEWDAETLREEVIHLRNALEIALAYIDGGQEVRVAARKANGKPKPSRLNDNI